MVFDERMSESTMTHAEQRSVPPDLLTPAALVLLVVGAVILLWQAASSYEIFKAIHVVAAGLWVGSAFMISLLTFILSRAKDAQTVAGLGRQIPKLSVRFFIPNTIVVLVFGIAMMIKGDLSWGTFWIDFALAVWILEFLSGPLFFERLSKKVAAVIERDGPSAPEVQRIMTLLGGGARLSVAVLLLVMIDMVVKPTF